MCSTCFYVQVQIAMQQVPGTSLLMAAVIHEIPSHLAQARRYTCTECILRNDTSNLTVVAIDAGRAGLVLGEGPAGS